MTSFFVGLVLGAAIVLFFYSRLFKRIEPPIRALIEQRDKAEWERDAAAALYKGHGTKA